MMKGSLPEILRDCDACLSLPNPGDLHMQRQQEVGTFARVGVPNSFPDVFSLRLQIFRKPKTLELLS